MIPDAQKNMGRCGKKNNNRSFTYPSLRLQVVAAAAAAARRVLVTFLCNLAAAAAAGRRWPKKQPQTGVRSFGVIFYSE